MNRRSATKRRWIVDGSRSDYPVRKIGRSSTKSIMKK
jgi:hypothetical protein